MRHILPQQRDLSENKVNQPINQRQRVFEAFARLMQQRLCSSLQVRAKEANPPSFGSPDSLYHTGKGIGYGQTSEKG